MTIKFYDCSTAPSPRRARILLAEKGIGVSKVEIDLRSGEQLTEAFRKINPRCTVPVLELEDGTRLADNAGIAAWAEAYRPTPPLFGTTPVERGLVATWNARVEQEGMWAVMDAVRNSLPGMKGRALPGPQNFDQIPELAERGRARLVHFFDELESQLDGREFLAIDAFSVADISAIVLLDFCAWIKVEPNDDQSNIHAWRARVNARPSIGA